MREYCVVYWWLMTPARVSDLSQVMTENCGHWSFGMICPFTSFDNKMILCPGFADFCCSICSIAVSTSASPSDDDASTMEYQQRERFSL